MTSSLVSIIIPMYNAEKYIRETLYSALDQTYKNIEIIVIDDGSTDKSSQIVSSIKDKRLKYKHQENSGVSSARNHGLSISKGKFINFLDSDDLLYKNAIVEKLKYFEKDKDFGIVQSAMQVIDFESIKIDDLQCGMEGWLLDDLLLWERNCVSTPSSVLVKRTVALEVGGFDEELSTAADQEFYFRVAKKYKIGCISYPLGSYRKHDQNMHMNIRLMERDHILAYKKARKKDFFKSSMFRKRCFGNLYKILAGSYWKDDSNKLRGILFLIKAILIYPKIIFKIIEHE
jgi:glycosyltransferase involved in cell wall biosynthesis